MPEAPPAVRCRAAFISDIHLGTKSCQAELLLEFIRELDCETLYLVGYYTRRGGDPEGARRYFARMKDVDWAGVDVREAGSKASPSIASDQPARACNRYSAGIEAARATATAGALKIRSRGEYW